MSNNAVLGQTKLFMLLRREFDVQVKKKNFFPLAIIFDFIEKKRKVKKYIKKKKQEN